MAFTATVLSWAILEYGDQMKVVNQLDPAPTAFLKSKSTIIPRGMEMSCCGLLPGSIMPHETSPSCCIGFFSPPLHDYMLSSLTTTLSCDAQNFAPSSLRAFAISQVDYVLGKNPMRMSYVVGYGNNYPKYVHHRGASIPGDEAPGCKDGFKWLNSDILNPNIALGALVGGPLTQETTRCKANPVRIMLCSLLPFFLVCPPPHLQHQI
ncbi:hypothetical protein ACS0TY_023550 [Phlomoides rotata]